jgi:hypothetical protein
MKTTTSLLLSSLLALVAIGPKAARLAAADEPSASWGKAADNKVYAQKLANEVMAANPDLKVIGLHYIAPGASEQKLMASNLDRIGKADDDDDKSVAKEQQNILGPNLTDPTKYEVLIPLQEKDGKVIGAIGLVWTYEKDKTNIVALFARSVAVRDALANRIDSISQLQQPADL